jgi:beta-mannosidase
VPGTAAAALRDAGRWAPGEDRDFDAEDWWFRTRFEIEPVGEGEGLVLCLDGIASVCEVYLDGSLVHEGASMFAAAEVEIGELLTEKTTAELAIRCRALGPLLRAPRKPRARWRTRLAEGGLRFQRTMLLGRAPGIAPGPAAVGPWRPLRIERRHRFAPARVGLRARLEGDDGVLAVSVALGPPGAEAPAAVEVELSGPSGEHRAALALERTGEGVEASGELRVPAVARWWPHTHGQPALHEVRLRLGAADGEEAVLLDAGRVGFRDLAPGPRAGHDAAVEGLDLHLNGVPVFARGAIWTPVDPIGLAPTEEQLRATLERVRAAGLNMVRIPGTAAYETAAFHDLCDELGILVWQDFANFDYPVADEGFRAAVEREARQVLAALAPHPSLAVLCGNSEVEQQVAMMGLDPALGRGELFGELLPRLCAEAVPGVPYLPSAPCGGAGEMPFRPDRGIANYFGIGGYRRPLADARSAGVRFAAECLALANVPGEAAVAALLGAEPTAAALEGPVWKGSVPRDAGAEWDFEDVRDHYLKELFGLDPGALRGEDPGRYLELSRAVSGELMAALFGEWRRAGSPCRGGIVLWLRDLAAGAGWGLLDDAGSPKVAYHHLRRALAPSAVWITDEGLAGVDVHLAHDGPEPLAARLRLALYRDFEQRVGEAIETVELAPHSAATRNVESMLGRFVDASWAYRFGPPAQRLIVASLERGEGAAEPLSQAVFFPAGRPTELETAERLGLRAALRRRPGGELELELDCERFVYGLRGLAPAADAFSPAPGAGRRVALRRCGGADPGAVALTALNLAGRVELAGW